MGSIIYTAGDGVEGGSATENLVQMKIMNWVIKPLFTPYFMQTPKKVSEFIHS